MFDSETYRNLAIIASEAKKRCSKKIIGAFFTMVKDFITVVANGITSGVHVDEWDRDSKLMPLYDKLRDSGNHFFDIMDEEYPEEVPSVRS